MLFTPGSIGSLELPNRMVRSATAEKMADPSGAPLPRLSELYTELARGGVGLIITGHVFISSRGKCHPEMTGIHEDRLIPSLEALTEVVHREGGQVVAQLNHGGGNCSPESVQQPLAPSADPGDLYKQHVSVFTEEQITSAISAFGRAARRAKEAGFDGVQIHAAHGYLISQFTSPLSNRREDRWGVGSRFLREVCQTVRSQVGKSYPVLIKFGMADGKTGGLTAEQGAEILAEFEGWGLDGVEISTGFSGDRIRSIQKGIRRAEEEAYLLPLVKKAREATPLPLMAVGGFRSRKVMEQVLLGGWADFISLSRPLIREPHLPRLLQEGEVSASSCLSANNCWPESRGEGIACKCPPLPD
jgi:2,4-dienoyl-CoA reductase-like NADH-dependent reductase (Old Yellow Enzyme family)